MHPFNNQIDLTDNIISRHFNQSLSNELFKTQFTKEEENSSNQISNQINNQLDRQVNRSNEQAKFNLDPNELINRNDKIRQLIEDCNTYVNNNNINNFVNYLGQSQLKDQNSSINSTANCHCKCHCTGHKKKNPFHLIKTNKLLNSLAKIKLNNLQKDKKSDNNSNEDYNTFTSSLSNYSLSSSSSISSQTISITSSQDNYNLQNNRIVLTKPTRRPPLPPINSSSLILNSNRSPFNKPPAKLPQFNHCLEQRNENQLNEQLNKQQNSNSLSKRLSSNEDTYERVITKSFEDLLVGDIKDRSKNYYDQNKPKKSSEQEEESIYETIDGDYDLDDKFKLRNQGEEEDLYQDIDVLDEEEEDIYESLTNEFTNDQMAKEEEKTNQRTNNENDLDRKIMKQQKILDKKRQLQAEKLRKKFNFKGNEIPLMTGVVKENVKGNHLNLTVFKNEIVLILRINEENPSGKWLAKNERSKIGYIDLHLVDVDMENYKCLMNEPNVF